MLKSMYESMSCLSLAGSRIRNYYRIRLPVQYLGLTRKTKPLDLNCPYHRTDHPRAGFGALADLGSRLLCTIKHEET